MRQQLRPGKFLANQNLAMFSQCNQVKCGLPQIDTDGCDVHDDDPPVELAELCYSAADHLINPGRWSKRSR
jgi:hypothetical protein